MEFKTFSLNLLILFCLICQITSEERIPQIKVVGTQITYLNPEYQTEVVYTIRKGNETFNYLNLFWNLKKDLPADVAIHVKVYVTDSTFQGGKLILDTTTPVCIASKDRELLPNLLQVREKNLNTQCVKKGRYLADSLELYRFEVQVPDIESLGNYYRAEYTFGNEAITIGTVNYYSEWGYLHRG